MLRSIWCCFCAERVGGFWGTLAGLVQGSLAGSRILLVGGFHGLFVRGVLYFGGYLGALSKQVFHPNPHHKKKPNKWPAGIVATLSEYSLSCFQAGHVF